MTFQATPTANLARATFKVPVSAGGNTFTADTGQGGLFPSVFPYYLIAEKYDTSSALEIKPVSKREVALVTNKVGDVFNVTRSAGFCPANDNALAQTNTAFSFDAGDTFFLANVSELYQDIQEGIEQKLDINAGLRTGFGAGGKIAFINNSGQEVIISLGGANTYLRSNGPTNAPDFGSPPLDINGQTSGTPLQTDYIAFFSVVDGVIHKCAISALIPFSTNTQASTGSNTNTTVTPLQLRKYYGPEPIAGTTFTDGISTAGLFTASTTYIKKAQFTIGRTGTYTVTFNMFEVGSSSCSGRIYKNGVAFGTAQGTTSNTPVNFTEDLAFTDGDTVELWLKHTDGSSTAQSSLFQIQHSPAPYLTVTTY